MTETKEQELKPMEFGDLTADYIMSQEWFCNDNSSAVRMNGCGSVVLCPSHLFTIDVVKELCVRICEEHNENLHRVAPQWSQGLPTEEGWYWVKKIPRDSGVRYPEDIVYVSDAGGKFYVLQLGVQRSVFFHHFCHAFKEVLWCKIDEPPPLPTEGRAE